MHFHEPRATATDVLEASVAASPSLMSSETLGGETCFLSNHPLVSEEKLDTSPHTPARQRSQGQDDVYENRKKEYENNEIRYIV